MRIYGLIGYPLSHSFSGQYFTDKFDREDIQDARYQNFPLENINDFPELISQNNISGLNVTIPYKEKILGYLDDLDAIAGQTRAVNTIKIQHNNTENPKLMGYNTDVFGFRASLKPLLNHHHEAALILGTGGASKAVEYVLKELGIKCVFVSRKSITSPNRLTITYEELNKNIISDYKLIVNTTPLGTYPNDDTFPEIPYEYLTSRHLLYDLVYNPSETVFLKKGKAKGAMTENGLNMLRLQADKAWEIWNS